MSAGSTNYPTSIDDNGIKDQDDEITSTLYNNHSEQIEAIQTALGASLLKIYPVGSVYINASVATNPATLLGFGTWSAIGAGRVLVGLDSGDTDFDVAGETGGSKTHDHSAATGSSSPSTSSNGAHTHTVASHTHTGPSHTHSISSSGNHNHDSAGGGSFLPGGSTAFTANSAGHNDTGAGGDHNHGGSTGSGGTGNTGAASPSTDSQGAHTHTVNAHTHSISSASNVQPYLVVYMWQRTA